MSLSLDMNLLDLGLVLIMLLFLVRGFFRGFVEEVAGLVGVLGGLWLAGRYHVPLGDTLLPYIKDPVWARMVAFAIILCAALLGVAAVVSLMNRFFALTFTDWLNHLCGGCVGLIKGLVICAVAVALLQAFLPDAPFVVSSKVRPHISQVSDALMQMLPLDLMRS